MWQTIAEAIKEIRKHTSKGSININTNGSMPKAVEALCQAGLNSIRVSTNSAQKNIYTAYYRPNNYVFEDIVESLKVMDKHGGWSSINYFVFPGITDSEAEYQALRKLIKATNLKMIQWRNFNIDPDWYMGRMNMLELGATFGVKQMMEMIHDEFPQVKFGYFNPPIERIKGRYEIDFAH
jgi:wyosine [tRNA(Phe)-imidazoG37] synthetase (radical SAM superfamily)